ncbi:MAG: tRNA (N(6)-L-threonylcarbamoyladenosine(37)-C(2))-methylthiotransferase MtaB [Omnitrophica WOR_2 bacterium RIFCSPHIGHO2_02_FULL_52_10]|nr:MAG: tRNA (N(6)-L-threonylcarbamoyladenosine(37)-C(2))-methylthiotransferase MtaB [Omnitrophica WOR_2 bacterium RIFCSPHIGHO2_02_FULL_52_10]
MRSVSFYTFGCRLNQSETAVIQRTFEAGGIRVVDVSQPADVVVVNTCTVTAHGDADTRKLVNRINRLNPRARIALIGCQAQIQKAKLAGLPNVRWVIGNARKMDVLELLREDDGSGPAWVITPTIPRGDFTVPVAGIDHRHTRANIKIQDGCDFFCSFCEIPYARGRGRSRKFEDILLEARALAAAGYKELVITGINVGTYDNSGKTILDVIDRLEHVEGIVRIRVSSIEPTTVPDGLIQRMAGKNKLCPHLHIPLQSANAQILKRMKRKYTPQEFLGYIRKAKATVPGICIGTDIITGFPGETEQQFLDALNALKEWPLDYAHVFSYSRRQMAKSRTFADEVSHQTTALRSQALRAMSLRKRALFLNSQAGTCQTVLFEQRKEGSWTGLTGNYCRVHARSDQNLKNCFLNVKIERAKGQTLVADLNGHP